MEVVVVVVGQVGRVVGAMLALCHAAHYPAAGSKQAGCETLSRGHPVWQHMERSTAQRSTA